MTIDTIIWGVVSTAAALFVGSAAALVHLASICPLINCLN